MSEHCNGTPQERSRGRWLFVFVRWLHVYVSLLGFFALVFFAVTGVTLNHPDWFYTGDAETREEQGTIDPAILNVQMEESAAAGEGLDEAAGVIGATSQVDKLAVVEILRSRHGVKGAVSEFSADEYQCIVIFKGPGHSADAFIDRATGEYTLTETYQGVVSVMNDLHKGRDSGPAWSWIVDVSAVIMTVASITGLALLLSSKRRRSSGLVLAVLGSVATILAYVLYVP